MRTLRRRSAFARGAAAAGFFACVTPRAAAAANLPGARLRLERAEGAEACVTEGALADELASRTIAKGTEEGTLLDLDVAIRRDGDAFEATIRVDGRKQGERLLRAQGPACDELHDALVVSLLLLLDEDPSSPNPPHGPEPVAPAAPLAPASMIAPVEPPPSQREQPELWLSLGGALTHGLPQTWSVAANADVIARLSRWEVSVGGFWAPEKRIAMDPGTVQVRVLGGRLRGCYAFATRSRLRWAGCALGAVGSLRGVAQEFTVNDSKTRPWVLGGLETDVELQLLPRLRVGICGAAAASAHTESFSIQGRGEVYRTDLVVASVGTELRLLIW
jgi:hypothetical protein